MGDSRDLLEVPFWYSENCLKEIKKEMRITHPILEPGTSNLLIYGLASTPPAPCVLLCEISE
jgi:hypothetical protein